MDAVAALVQVGMLDLSGRLITAEAATAGAPGLAGRLRQVGAERVFVLHPRGPAVADAVYLAQRDVRELQFGKAAIATGWRLLLESRA